MPAKSASNVRIAPTLYVIATTLYLFWINTSPAAEKKAPQQVNLSPRISAGDLQHVKVLFELDGTLTLKAETSGPVTTPVKLKAQMIYDEKVVEPATRVATWPQSTVRSYETAKATIKFREGEVQPNLREDRRIVGVSAAKTNNVVLYSPLGPMSRDELDLIDLPANSALIDGLLPNRTVSVGDTWKLNTDILPAILGLDAISHHTLECTLDRIQDNLAVLHAKGTVTGAAEGVTSEIALAAKFSFDMTRRRVSWFAMSLNERRAVGHAQPGIKATARVQMAIAGRSHVPTLDPNVLADLNLTADDASRLLEFSSPTGGFEILIERNWHEMVERQDVSVLRLVDRGDLIAQCNISALPPVDEGEQFTIVEFQQDVKNALEANFGEFVTASESLSDSGLHIMRVVATGRTSDLSIDWVYYHISNNESRRASCVFTYESELADRFGAADQTLISSFRFSEPAASITGAAK